MPFTVMQMSVRSFSEVLIMNKFWNLQNAFSHWDGHIFILMTYYIDFLILNQIRIPVEHSTWSKHITLTMDHQIHIANILLKTSVSIQEDHVLVCNVLSLWCLFLVWYEVKVGSPKVKCSFLLHFLSVLVQYWDFFLKCFIEFTFREHF